MTSMARTSNEVIVGVDTHKDQHVAVSIDQVGRRRDELSVPATVAGYQQLLDWTQSQGTIAGFGVEGTGSYGKGLTRFLHRNGVTVTEVTRPPRANERRLDGKSDPIDAEHAARRVLSRQATAIPKTSNGAIEAIRLVKIARNTAVKAHSQAMITLKASLVTASDELRDELADLTDRKLIAACATFAPDDVTKPDNAMRHLLGSLARRWLDLHEEIKTHTRHLTTATTATAPQLVAAFGIGFDSAAQLLITVGDNPDRIRTEATFAKLCGVCPIPASSGKTNGRYRLNRGGNRRANAALYRIVIVRLRWHQPTKDYMKRRTAQGLTKSEIIRCLKRYVAREVYNLLPTIESTS